MNLVIRDLASLANARGVIDADLVTVETARLKFRNLLPCAMKYAFWATRLGGRIVVVDDGGKDAAPGPYSVSFNLVRQWVFKYIGAGCRLVSLEPGRLELERMAAPLVPGWGAGVVFSGNDGEIPTLRACLDGLLRQPELATSNGGEIVVCGPRRDTAFLSDYPDVRYHEFETPPGPRFLIGRKKNALMAAMTAPRMVVLHARVVLDERALSRVPREFDISGPAVRYASAHRGEQPYLSLIQTDGVWPGFVGRRATVMLRDVADGNPLALIERGGVFVDGGAFYVTRTAFKACPLHEEVAWEEGEDVEWCGRAFAQGLLVDLALESGALSQTNKLGDRSKLGSLERPARRARSAVKLARAALTHRVLRGLGRR